MQSFSIKKSKAILLISMIASLVILLYYSQLQTMMRHSPTSVVDYNNSNYAKLNSGLSILEHGLTTALSDITSTGSPQQNYYDYYDQTDICHALAQNLTCMNGINKTFIRAAIVYYPCNDERPDFLAELQWFIRSWKEMKKYEPEKWRTDIFIFSNAMTEELKLLNCSTTIRKTLTEPGICIIISDYVSLLTSHNFTYAVSDSINVVAVFDSLPGVEIYDWILRTDLDTFLTPAFSTFKPNKMILGGGAYDWGSDYITYHRLERISQDLNLTSHGSTNIGSTWYGPRKIVSSCAKLSVSTMMYIDKWEFSKIEKITPFLGQNWPEWHYGVLALYGGHVAINHCTKKNEIEIQPELFDFPSHNNMSIWDHPHIHTWHTEENFSKFAFFRGDYYNVRKNSINNTELVPGYSLFLALDSVTNPNMVNLLYN